MSQNSRFLLFILLASLLWVLFWKYSTKTFCSVLQPYPGDIVIIELGKPKRKNTENSGFLDTRFCSRPVISLMWGCSTKRYFQRWCPMKFLWRHFKAHYNRNGFNYAGKNSSKELLENESRFGLIIIQMPHSICFTAHPCCNLTFMASVYSCTSHVIVLLLRCSYTCNAIRSILVALLGM